jgi:hypothetical protein
MAKHGKKCFILGNSMKMKCLIRILFSLTLLSSFDFSQIKLNEPEKVVLSFYKWYLKDVYLKNIIEAPVVKLTKDGIYQIDTTDYIKFLNQSDYFSIQFYKSEIAMFIACNKKLRDINPKQKEDAPCFPANLVKGHECDFLCYMAWTGGQGESLNTVGIVKSEVTADSAKVITVLGDSISGPYSYPIVSLMNEHNKWKISRIEVSYEKPN